VRIPLDECVPARLKAAFPGHTVRSVTETAWRSSTDKSILGFAQKHFDVFLTVDRNLEKQHDLGKLRLGFVVAHVPNNRLDAFQPILRELRDAVETVRCGEVAHVKSPERRSTDPR
jgi:predicted nuclease of predicted toxin-antitoxin system